MTRMGPKGPNAPVAARAPPQPQPLQQQEDAHPFESAILQDGSAGQPEMRACVAPPKGNEDTKRQQGMLRHGALLSAAAAGAPPTQRDDHSSGRVQTQQLASGAPTARLRPAGDSNFRPPAPPLQLWAADVALAGRPAAAAPHALFMIDDASSSDNDGGYWEDPDDAPCGSDWDGGLGTADSSDPVWSALTAASSSGRRQRPRGEDLRARLAATGLRRAQAACGDAAAAAAAAPPECAAACEQAPVDMHDASSSSEGAPDDDELPSRTGSGMSMSVGSNSPAVTETLPVTEAASAAGAPRAAAGVAEAAGVPAAASVCDGTSRASDAHAAAGAHCAACRCGCCSGGCARCFAAAAQPLLDAGALPPPPFPAAAATGAAPPLAPPLPAGTFPVPPAPAVAAAAPLPPLLPAEVYLGFVAQLVESVRVASRAAVGACAAHDVLFAAGSPPAPGPPGGGA